MRRRVIALAGLLPCLAAGPAAADVPQSIVALLGPSLGHLMAQNDLCGWKLDTKIEGTYKASFQTIGLTQAQQTTVWEKAGFARQGMMSTPAAAQDRMKSEMCTPAIKARIEQDLAN